MSEVIVIGPPQSSYVRTARMTCVEKGVPHRLEPIEIGSDALGRLHPWRKVPVLRHGDVQIYETSAIIRYIDEAFDGPRLTPAPPIERAIMEQWISALNCYIYEEVIKGYALLYVLPKLRGAEPNRQLIEASLPKVDRDFGLLDDAYGARRWIAGDALSLADLVVAPIVQTVAMFPEGAAALEKHLNLKRAFGALQGRESFKTAHAGIFG